MNVLVAVASKHGSTREIARVIANDLQAAGIPTDLCEVREVTDLSRYDAFVLGSGVYAGNWLPDMRSFAAQHAATLSGRPVWVFSSGPLGAPDSQPPANPARLAAALGAIAVREHRIFAGKLDQAHLAVPELVVAALVRAPVGDFRAWDAIHTWARTIASALQPVALATD